MFHLTLNSLKNNITKMHETLHNLLSLGSGPKTLLLDNTTLKIISSHIKHSEILNHDIFLIDLLTNKRDKICDLTCLIFIRPEMENLELLKQELYKPLYGDYYIISSNYISTEFIKMIASFDTKCLIRGLYEAYVDLIKQDVNFYTLYSRNEGYLKNDNRDIDGLFSLCKYYECVPIIRAMNNEKCKFIGEALLERLSFNNVGCDSEGKDQVFLLILDRSFDPITPLLHNWAFQPMIDEYFGLNENIVLIDNKNIVTDHEIYQSLKFVDVQSVSGEIKTFTGDKSILQSKEAISMIEETANRKKTSENLLTIYNNLVKNCIKFRDSSDLEYKILNNKLTDSQVVKSILDKGLCYERRLKILLIYMLKNRNFNIEDQIFHVFNEFRRDLRMFYNLYITGFGYRWRFQKNIDLKLGYEPYLKVIVSDIVNGKLCNKNFTSINHGRRQKNNILILYINGGATYSEYKAINEYIKRKNVMMKVILVGDKIINYKDVLKNIMKY